MVALHDSGLGVGSAPAPSSGAATQQDGSIESNTNNASGTFNRVDGDQHFDARISNAHVVLNVVQYLLFSAPRRDSDDYRDFHHDHGTYLERLEARVERLETAAEGTHPDVRGTSKGSPVRRLWQGILGVICTCT
ncbi:hypothetical protein PTI98_010796 [Pleurotus ostreatus]|nr:hypothetical protein PTI98_010796 [Pleurotus ostreatus]